MGKDSPNTHVSPQQETCAPVTLGHPISVENPLLKQHGPPPPTFGHILVEIEKNEIQSGFRIRRLQMRDTKQNTPTIFESQNHKRAMGLRTSGFWGLGFTNTMPQNKL